jgi:hypothetical protein
MRRFVLGWKMLGLERSLGSRIVTYADDLVILCRKGKAEEALQRLREIMDKLTVNEEKTRICKVPEGEFDFLGYTFGRMYSARTGKAYLGYRPSKKSIRRMVENVHALTTRSGTWQKTTEQVNKLNRTLRGWANYFEVGTVSKAYRTIDNYRATSPSHLQQQLGTASAVPFCLITLGAGSNQPSARRPKEPQHLIECGDAGALRRRPTVMSDTRHWRSTFKVGHRSQQIRAPTSELGQHPPGQR